MRIHDSKGIVAFVTGALLTLTGATGAAAQGMTAVDVVIGASQSIRMPSRISLCIWLIVCSET